MEFDSDSDELAELLRAAADEGEITLGAASKSDDKFGSAISGAIPNDETQTSDGTQNAAVKLAEEAYDSSDEEDLQNFFERKYNEYGRDINTMLKRKDADRVDIIVGNEVSKSMRQSDFTFGKRAPPKPPVTATKRTTENLENVYTDPIFGLRLIQPLVSSTALRERMLGRKVSVMPNHVSLIDNK